MRPMVIRRTALARISAWLDGDGRFLLVTGSLGGGKTIAAQQLVDALDTANVVCAQHFCEADNTATIAVGALLSNWSTRLCQQLPGFYENLARDGGAHFTGTASGPESIGLLVGEARITVGDESPAEAFYRSIARPLERLAVAGLLPRTVLIVDGVEEARDADGRNRILTLLSGLTGTALPASVRIVALSRPDHNVRIALEGADHLDLDATGGHDVAEYIAPHTTPRFAAELSEHVHGNFLLATSILDDLATAGESLTAASIPALPRTLPGIFRKRLWRMVDERDQELLDVLGLLAIARAPLQEREIASLLGQESHRVRAAVNHILPVLAHDPVRRRHRLVHRALAEFLLDPDENRLPVRSAASMHATIATRMYDTWSGRWEQCDEPYPMHHLVAHLTMAPDTRSTLTHLLTDPAFLQAKAAMAGVDGLHADLCYAMPYVPEAHRVDRALLRQAHHLRHWEAHNLPGLFVQQLQHDAVITQDDQFASVLSGYLEAKGLAHLRLAWAHTTTSSYANVLAGHRGNISAIAVTRNGKHAVTASDDGTARVWDLDTGRLIHTLGGHDGAVTCVAVSPDGSHVITGATDGAARLWDLDSGQLLRSLTGAEDALTEVIFTPDGTHALAASWDRTVRVWNIPAGRQVRTMRGHQARVEGLKMMSDEQVVTWSADGTHRVWELSTGRETHRYTLPGPGPKPAFASTDDNTRVIIGRGNTATVWDRRDETRRGQRAHRLRVNAIAVVGGQRLLTGSGDGASRVWDMRTGKLVGVLDPRADAVTALAESAGGTLAVLGGWDGLVEVWNLRRERRLHAMSGHLDMVTSVVVTGSRAITASWDTTLRIWDLRSGSLTHTLSGHEDWVNAVAMTPEGRLAISASSDGTARVWDVHNGQERLALPHRSPLTALAVTPDGTRVITAARDGVARVWDVRDGTLVRLLAGHEDAVNAVAVAEERLVTGSADGTAVVWDLRHDEPLHTIEGHPGPVSAVAAAGAGVVTVSANTVRVWSPEATVYAGLSEAITCLAVRLPAITVGTESGGLFSYLVMDQGLRTRATPKGMSAGLPDGS